MATVTAPHKPHKCAQSAALCAQHAHHPRGVCCVCVCASANEFGGTPIDGRWEITHHQYARACAYARVLLPRGPNEWNRPDCKGRPYERSNPNGRHSTAT